MSALSPKELTSNFISNFCSEDLLPIQVKAFTTKECRVRKTYLMTQGFRDQHKLYENLVAMRNKSIKDLTVAQLKQCDKNIDVLAQNIGVKHLPYKRTPGDRMAILVQDMNREMEGLEGPELKLSKWKQEGLLREAKMLTDGEEIPAAHAVPSVLAENSIAPSNDEISDRKNIVTKIFTTVSNCYPEDQLHVCAILYAKFECSTEEKKHIAFMVKFYDGIDVSALTDREIPKYKEAPEEQREAADKFLAYAGNRMSNKLGRRNASKICWPRS